MPTIRIPQPLRAHTGDRAEVVVAGSDVRAALAELVRRHPGLEDRVLDADGQLQRFLNVFVGDDDIRHRSGLDTEVADTDVVTLVPAVAGGVSEAPSGGWMGSVRSSHASTRSKGGVRLR